jgi:hypothetical protein
VSSKKLKVRYKNFWKSFDYHNNFFNSLISESGYRLEITRNRFLQVDIEIVSVFPSVSSRILRRITSIMVVSKVLTHERINRIQLGIQMKLRKSQRRIWYTGENIRPPYSQDFDGYLSFDANDAIKNNAYFPLWYFDAGLIHDNTVARVGKTVAVHELLEPRNVSLGRRKLACIFMGNPHPFRLRFIEEMKRFGEVDCYGSYFGHPIRDKLSVGKNYKFIISFENDFYPGYVTEKLLETYLSFSVPIYWGGLLDDSVINRNAIVMKDEDETFSALAERVHALTDSQIELMLQEPFLVRIPDFSQIRRVLFGDNPSTILD